MGKSVSEMCNFKLCVWRTKYQDNLEYINHITLLLCRSIAFSAATTTQLNSKGHAEGNSSAGIFQLNHCENTITLSQTQAGDTVSLLPLHVVRGERCASWECPCTWSDRSTHIHCKHNHFNTWNTHCWLEKCNSCSLNKTILAFSQKTHTVRPQHLFVE